MSIIGAIKEVFTAVSTWITESVTALIPMFYDSGTGLTFLGTLSVVSLCVSLCFLLVGLIQNFLHFRG